MKRERDTASVYVAPPHIVAIAAERTHAITRQWAAEIVWRPADFMVLAESCYMQGMNDTIDAVVKAGWIPKDAADAPVHFGALP